MSVKGVFAALVCVAAVAAVAFAQSTPPPGCDPCQPVFDNHTTIESVPGLRATAELVPNYGTCSVTNKGYRWKVNWGNGVEYVANSTYLMPAQTQYTYNTGGRYNITAYYCSYPEFCCEKCSMTWKVVTVS
eukprot:m.360731 g.360731  ORF g.360731 m.360731 type:complete len:131 (+) comp19148_c0_seq1:100-492(+)